MELEKHLIEQIQQRISHLGPNERLSHTPSGTHSRVFYFRTCALSQIWNKVRPTGIEVFTPLQQIKKGSPPAHSIQLLGQKGFDMSRRQHKG